MRTAIIDHGLLMLGLSLGLVACGGGRETARVTPPRNQPAQPTTVVPAPTVDAALAAVETFDPLTTQDRIDPPGPAPMPDVKPQPVAPTGPRSVRGYRVQVANVTSIGEANRIRAELAGRVQDGGAIQAVYVDFEQPNYKVRVGDLRDRAAADRVISLLSDLGYTDSWAVPATVTVP